MDTAIVTDAITPATARPAEPAVSPGGRHFAWIDLRSVAPHLVDAVTEAALHQRVDGIVSDSATRLATLPPTVRRILAADPSGPDIPAGVADLVLWDADAAPEGAAQAAVQLVVSDAPSLTRACELVRQAPWTVLTFTDPTKIPLEIVIAAAGDSGGRIVTAVEDLTDAEIVRLVLEHGSDGLLLRPLGVDDVARVQRLVNPQAAAVDLVTLVVDRIEHVGLGDRACIDTCSLLESDEGCLIGSFATGFFLSCSETHPLPYMPTRPFRWNAGAVHSYVLVPGDRTRYVTELAAGAPILAVRSDGSAREVRVGRVKIERRPLLSISAVTPGGAVVNVVTQDDWHVRLLGPGGVVHNVTELRPGDRLLGHVPTASRHVGLPIAEFCVER
ncbi:3-dehydroquinate synthase II family protein [Micromonospora sp. CA-263727]|uniref:3-dehydroquinate synthase II family protein n=1 Tax=Micromonospora sp. CA-263727 TaxID=3239967 RepID=UPI003D8E8005